MSAYVVDREHIMYLVEAARSDIGGVRRLDGLRWRSGPALNELPRDATPEECRRVAQMLWDANIHGVNCRYPDSEEGLPGPNEDYIIRAEDFRDRHWRQPFDPIQVLKACQCYAYQTCEDPEWEKTEAYMFIKALKEVATNCLPGYEDCKWGAPQMDRPLEGQREVGL